MKNIIFIVSGLILLSVSCRKDIDIVETSYIYPTPKGFVKSSIGGLVVDENDNAIIGAKVSIIDKSVLTDDNGVFLFNNVIANENGAYIHVEKDGFFHGSRTIITAEGSRNTVKIQLISNTKTSDISSITGDIISTNDYSIVFPANGFVTALGGDYAGVVRVSSKWLDPSDNKIMDKMPGRLIGLGADGKTIGMATMGMLLVELRDGPGNLLKLKDGFEATIKMRVPPDVIFKAPSTIPLWYFDEIKGSWIEEGSATLISGFYEGKVKHFSCWNTDFKLPLVDMSFKVMDANGKPIEGALVLVSLLNSSGYGKGYTDNFGKIYGKVPQDESLKLTITLPYVDCTNLSIVQQIGPYNQNDSISITLNNTLLYNYTITGDLINCSGVPVTNGYIKIKDQKEPVWLDAKGHFIKTIYKCNPQANGKFELHGIDNDAFKESENVIVNVINGGEVNAGAIQVCSSLSEYITYTFEGNTYFYTDLTISGASSNKLIVKRILVIDKDLSIHVEILNPIGLGFNTVDFVHVYGFNKDNKFIRHYCDNPNTSCMDIKTNITEFGGPGEFVSGTISGSLPNLTDTLNIAPVVVSGTFRAKWNN